MVKHNNVLPNQHFKKQWQRRVRVNLDQPARALRRRNKRKAKAKEIFPRPLGKLRPIVQCQTQRYNMRSKLGRGFTETELKGAGISVYYAPTIGIAVDKRRKNRSQEGLDRNIARLKTYMDNLIVFDRKGKKDFKSVVQSVSKVILPPAKQVDTIEYAEVTQEMKEFSARQVYRAQVAYAKDAAMKAHPKFDNS